MADAAELEQKFLKADALAQQGDAQAKADAKLFRDEIVRLQSAPAAKPVAQNIMPSMVDSMKQVLSEESSPFGAKVIGGMGVELDKGAMRIKQAVQGLNPSDVTQVQQDRQFGEAAGLPGVVGASLPYVVPGARLAQAGAAAVAPAMSRVAASLFGAGVAGGVQNVTTNPVLPGESEAANAGTGIVGGMVGQAIPGVASKLVQPITQSPAVQRLIQQGVIPTMGQAIGGMAKTIESKLTSTPVLGDVIRWGAHRPVQEVNRAAIQTVSPNITDIGNEGVRQAQRAAGRAYDAVLPHITVVPDARFVGMTTRIENDATHLLTEEQRRQFRDFVTQRIIDPLRRGPQVLTPAGQNPGTSTPIVSGEIFKEIDSELGSTAARYRKSASASEKNLGDAFQRLQGEWRDLVQRNAPPQFAQALDDANRMWANLTILERAAAKSKTGNGEFTAAQLQQAVRESDQSIRKRAFAGGNARMQPGLSNPAVDVLGSGYADSGTAGRALMHNPAAWVTGAIAGTAALPFYSRAGSRYMLGDLIPGQEAGANAIRRGAPYATSLGATLSDYARNK